MPDHIKTIFMTIEEATETSGIPKQHLYRFVKKKGFPAIKIGVRWFIHRQLFEEWCKEQLKTKYAA